MIIIALALVALVVGLLVAYMKGTRSFRRNQPGEQHIPQTTHLPEPMSRKEELRVALSKCVTLTKQEIDEYILYEYDAVLKIHTPLDLEFSGRDIVATGYWYKDDLLQSVSHRIYTHQISPGTLRKVLRVLPLLCAHSGGSCTSGQHWKCLHCASLHRP